MKFPDRLLEQRRLASSGPPGDEETRDGRRCDRPIQPIGDLVAFGLATAKAARGCLPPLAAIELSQRGSREDEEIMCLGEIARPVERDDDALRWPAPPRFLRATAAARPGEPPAVVGSAVGAGLAPTPRLHAAPVASHLNCLPADHELRR